MEDQYGSFVDLCNYSSSQEDLLTHSLFAREDEIFPDSHFSPESYDPVPAPPDAAGIFICSPPVSPASKTETISQAEEFRTPPEESRLSSSEDPPQLPPHISAVDSPDGGARGGEGIATVDVDCRDSGGEGGDGVVGMKAQSELGFSGEKRSPMEVLVSGENVRVGDTSAVKIKFFGDKERGKTPEKESSAEPPSKRAKITGKDSCLSTPNEAVEELPKSGLNAMNAIPLSFIPPENGKPVTGEGEACAGGSDGGKEEKADEGESPSPKGKFRSPLEMKVQVQKSDIIDADGNLGISDGRRETTDIEVIEVDDEKEDKEGYGEGDENGNEEIVEKHWKRDLPTSITQPMQENRYGYLDAQGCVKAKRGEKGGESNGERVDRSKVSSGTEQLKSLLEVLAMFSREIDNGEAFDILETAKRRGMKFPRPRWWRGVGGNDWLED